MKFLFAIFAFLLISSSPLAAQSWVDNIYQRFADGNERVNQVSNVIESFVGQEAPSISFRNIDEDNLTRLEAYRGTPVLVVSFRSTCYFCVQLVPEIERLEETYDLSELQVLHISQENERTLKAFRDQYNVKSDMAIGANVLNFPAPFQIRITPTIILVDAEGIIRETWIGAVPYEILSQSVASL